MAQVSTMASHVSRENKLLVAENKRLMEAHNQQANSVRQLQVGSSWKGSGHQGGSHSQGMSDYLQTTSCRCTSIRALTPCKHGFGGPYKERCV